MAWNEPDNDDRKDDLSAFVARHLDFFRQHELVATGNTGKRLHDELGLTVERVAHGPHGGDLIIGGRVATDEVVRLARERHVATVGRDGGPVAAGVGLDTRTVHADPGGVGGDRYDLNGDVELGR